MNKKIIIASIILLIGSMSIFMLMYNDDLSKEDNLNEEEITNEDMLDPLNSFVLLKILKGENYLTNSELLYLKQIEIKNNKW